jgi:tetratricopeptide (TPR) repeat protein
LDAAAAVCSGDDLAGISIFDLLTSLTEKSLVIADTRGEQQRYRLLESTGAYALEKLIASGQREPLARRHAEYVREQAEAADELRGSGSRSAWLAELELELDNYRAALEWALTQNNDALLGGAIAGALGALWYDRLVAEGRYWIELALPRLTEPEQPATMARLQLTLSSLSNGQRKLQPAQLAMKLYESVGDLRGAARAERLCGFALYQMGQIDDAREAIARALAVSRGCGDVWNVPDCLNLLAMIEVSRGDLRAGRELFGRALAEMKARGDELGVARLLGNMAELAFAAGDPEQALRLIHEALELASLRRHRLTATWHNNSTAYCVALGDLSEARGSALEALRLARQVGHEVSTVVALQHLALLAALGGNTKCGAQLLGYVDARYRQLGLGRERTEQWGYDKLLVALREVLTESETTRLAAEGAAWSEDRAVGEALKI